MRALLIVLGVSALGLAAALAGPRPGAGQAPAPETPSPEAAEPAGAAEPLAEAEAPAPVGGQGSCDSCALRHERIRKLKEAREAEAVQEAD
ncbi:MAG: hypothetical protein OEM59_10740 [Rhodospirillales bacterium]|nr:hypothetical protein [Rhodospirillales bacterium]